MTRYLLDTNVISEFRRNKPHGAVIEWTQSIKDTELFISACTAGEIQAGIELTKRNDLAKALSIEAWLQTIIETYNMIPADHSVYRKWAQITVGKPNQISEDAMIAATALVHNLTVVTRNVKDFAQFKVPVLNPFKTASLSRRG